MTESNPQSMECAGVYHPNPRMEHSGDDLYCMTLSTDPNGTAHGIKVGSSDDIDGLVDFMSESMPFKIIVLAKCIGAGWAEERVHIMLGPTRSASGGNWFHATLPTVLHAVACALEQ